MKEIVCNVDDVANYSNFSKNYRASEKKSVKGYYSISKEHSKVQNFRKSQLFNEKKRLKIQLVIISNKTQMNFMSESMTTNHSRQYKIEIRRLLKRKKRPFQKFLLLVYLRILVISLLYRSLKQVYNSKIFSRR